MTVDALTLWHQDQQGPYKSTRASVTQDFPNGDPTFLGEDQAYAAKEGQHGVYFMANHAQPQLYVNAGNHATAILGAHDGALDGYSVSSDERTLYFSSNVFSDAGNAYLDTVYRATRTELTQPFAAPTSIAGLGVTADVPSGVSVGWVSDDECVLYGSALLKGASDLHIVRALRPR
jgi:hypothetical protein